ncbi:hypothetical protein CL622_05275 [archaeon]|nr:hypothetical protein [archaeon]|tara:strand:+ start:115 stop:717 length:603 start_codon:yes stop_codon:yes gene_type:complete
MCKYLYNGGTYLLHMLQKYSRYKLLEIFFKFPTKVFHIRELSRMIDLAQPSVKNHLIELMKEKLIQKTDEGLYGGYHANRDDDLFRHLKQQNTVFTLHQSGCINYLFEQCMPQAIILLGSASKGEDTEESDIDIFVEAKEEVLDLKKYEKILNRKIHVIWKENFGNLSVELKNNLVNGTILHGVIRAFENEKRIDNGVTK